ncbi:hypothetical protein BGZ46_010168 [Entomortierella lignicola]|nr:hypothetical protein BGZ46_010168 [Entomortierella lignicola]
MDSSAEPSSVAAGKRRATEPIEQAPAKRSVASSSKTKLEDLEDNSEQEDEDLDEDLDFLDTSNIIHSGRRTRGVKIDFSKVSQEDLDDDDEDDVAVAPVAEEEEEEEEEDDEDDEEEQEEENGEEDKQEEASSSKPVESENEKAKDEEA